MVTNWVLYKEKLFILHFHRQEIKTQDVNSYSPPNHCSQPDLSLPLSALLAQDIPCHGIIPTSAWSSSSYFVVPLSQCQYLVSV